MLSFIGPFSVAILLALVQGTVTSPRVIANDTTTTTGPTLNVTTSTRPPLKYCPVGWCLDTEWFEGHPCITPAPKELRVCWDNFCRADAQRRGIHPTNAQGRGQGTYCKNWQDPEGRLCFHDTKLHCQCDSLNTTASSPKPKDGWTVADPCSYPPPPGPLSTTPSSPTTRLIPTFTPSSGSGRLAGGTCIALVFIIGTFFTWQ